MSAEPVVVFDVDVAELSCAGVAVPYSVRIWDDGDLVSLRVRTITKSKLGAAVTVSKADEFTVSFRSGVNTFWRRAGSGPRANASTMISSFEEIVSWVARDAESAGIGTEVAVREAITGMFLSRVVRRARSLGCPVPADVERLAPDMVLALLCYPVLAGALAAGGVLPSRVPVVLTAGLRASSVAEAAKEWFGSGTGGDAAVVEAVEGVLAARCDVTWGARPLVPLTELAAVVSLAPMLTAEEVAGLVGALAGRSWSGPPPTAVQWDREQTRRLRRMIRTADCPEPAALLSELFDADPAKLLDVSRDWDFVAGTSATLPRLDGVVGVRRFDAACRQLGSAQRGTYLVRLLADLAGLGGVETTTRSGRWRFVVPGSVEEMVSMFAAAPAFVPNEFGTWLVFHLVHESGAVVAAMVEHGAVNVVQVSGRPLLPVAVAEARLVAEAAGLLNREVDEDAPF